MSKHRLVIFLFGFFTLPLTLLLIWLLAQARYVDATWNGTVPTTGDDDDYQRLAINLRHGVGYTESIILPIQTYLLDLTSSYGMEYEEQYREQGSVIIDPVGNFYRAPGYPMLLSALYTLFGDSTLAARQITVVMIWGIAMLVMATGLVWAGWRGTLAGGIAGLLYMLPYMIRSSGLENFLTEVPTTFWVMVFGFFFVLHQRTRRMRYFVALAFAMVGLIYTRANFLLLLPLFAGYFFFARYGWKKLLAFVVIVAIPVAFWSAYASAGVGKFVSFTTRGEDAFPQYNNMDVITGVGPDRLFQGDWNPGYYVDSQGVIRQDDRFVPKPGENGWVKGLAFWRENPTLVPELFYVKLREGFWTEPTLAGVYAAGLCFLLLSIGFRPASQTGQFLPQISNRRILTIQVVLALGATMLMSIIGKPIYGLVLCIYVIIFLLALARPYGRTFRLSASSPVWFLIFVGSHLVTTLLYMGVRFHEPLDPLLCMFGIYGVTILFEALLVPSRRYSRAANFRHEQPEAVP